MRNQDSGAVLTELGRCHKVFFPRDYILLRDLKRDDEFEMGEIREFIRSDDGEVAGVVFTSNDRFMLSDWGVVGVVTG